MVGGVDAPDALRLGVGGNLGVHGGNAGGGLHEPHAVDVRRAVVPGFPGEQPGVGEFAERGRGNGRDDGDFGPGVEQSLGAARGSRAAANHQHGAAEQAQCRGIDVLYCHAKTVGPGRNMLQSPGNTG